MLKVKPGVSFTPSFGGARILEVLKRISADLGKDLTITSGSDGVHSGPSDPHYSGNAYDIRAHDLSVDQKALVVRLLTADLGPAFYAFLESPGTGNEHIHIQTRKGTTYTILDYLKEE